MTTATPKKKSTKAKAAEPAPEMIANLPAETEPAALVTVEKLTAIEIFTADKIAELLKKVEKEKVNFIYPADLSDEAAQDAVKSFAFRFTKTKTLIDGIGKEYVAILKDEPARIDKLRKQFRDTLDQWAEEVRAPVTAIEAAEKVRKDEHGLQLDELSAITFFTAPNPAPALVQTRIKRLAELKARDWQEFDEIALPAIERAETTLADNLAAAVKYEQDQIELATLKREKAERDEKDRLEKIRLDAIEEGKRLQAQAEEAARAKAAEAPAVVAAVTATQAAEPTPAPAQVNGTAPAAQAAPTAQTMGYAGRALTEAEKAQQLIHREILADLLKYGATEAGAKALITAIAKGALRHVRIDYSGKSV